MILSSHTNVVDGLVDVDSQSKSEIVVQNASNVEVNIARNEVIGKITHVPNDSIVSDVTWMAPQERILSEVQWMNQKKIHFPLGHPT